MGTSTGYELPKNPQWKPLKRLVTSIAKIGNGYPSEEKARKVIRNYIRANGGAKHLGNTGNIIKSAKNIGVFFNSIKEKGLQSLLTEIGFGSLEGKSVDQIIFFLIDYLGGPFSTIDQVDARNALSRLIAELCEGIDDPKELEKILEEKASISLVDNLLVRYFAFYMFERFCRMFYENLMQKVGENNTKSFLNGIQDFIISTLENVQSKHDVKTVNWDGDEGTNLMQEIFVETLEIFTGGESSED